MFESLSNVQLLFPYKLYKLLIGIVDKSLTGVNEWTKGRFDMNGPKVVLIRTNGPKVVLM